MNDIKLYNIISDNQLLNKIDIKSMPLVDSSNPNHIEEIQGNNLRAMKSAPLIYDFMTNLIHELKIMNIPLRGENGAIQDLDNDYYSIKIDGDDFIKSYLGNASSFTIRQSLLRQISNSQIPYIFLRYETGIRKMTPFNIITDFDNNGEIFFTIKFSKLVFKSLVENINKDGFIYIAKNLFPISTYADLRHNKNTYNGKKVIESHNPFYRINIYGLRKNTHKKGSITVDKQDFFKNVIPELILNKRVNNFHLKTPASVITNSLKPGLLSIKENLPENLIVRNLYLGNIHDNKVILYFENHK